MPTPSLMTRSSPSRRLSASTVSVAVSDPASGVEKAGIMPQIPRNSSNAYDIKNPPRRLLAMLPDSPIRRHRVVSRFLQRRGTAELLPRSGASSVPNLVHVAIQLDVVAVRVVERDVEVAAGGL